MKHIRTIILGWAAWTCCALGTPHLLAREDPLSSQIKIHKEISRANANDPAPLQKLGSLYLQAGKPRKAVFYFRKVLQMDSAQIPAWVELGNCFLAMGKPTEAIDAFERALEIDPSLGPAYANLGVAHLRQGTPENAIRILQKSLEVAPDQSLAHYHLAEAYWTVGEVDAAISEMNACIVGLPNLLRAHMRLAEILEETGRYIEAIKAYQEARELSPTLPLIHLRLARLFDYKLTHIPEALQSYKSYMRWNEGTDRKVRRRIDLLTDQLYVSALKSYSVGDIDRAMDLLQHILDIKATHKSARELANKIRAQKRTNY